MKKLTPKKVNVYSLIILAVGTIIAIAGVLSEQMLLSATGMAIMFGDIFFRLIFYRCPHCGKFLDRSAGDFCPYCGKDVNQ